MKDIICNAYYAPTYLYDQVCHPYLLPSTVSKSMYTIYWHYYTKRMLEVDAYCCPRNCYCYLDYQRLQKMVLIIFKGAEND